MDNIRQKRPNEGPIFKVNKKRYRQFLNNKFTHKKRNLWSLRPSKINSLLLLEIKILSEKLLVLPQS